MAQIYLAGGLFNTAERCHNLYLERELTAIGHTIALPQRRAKQYFNEGAGSPDLAGIVKDCEDHCTNPAFITVGCGDGADADSGTSYELGAAKWTTGRAIVYRTDFRTAPEVELGINAMLRAECIHYVYFPCFVTELSEVDAYYRELARRIDTEVKTLV